MRFFDRDAEIGLLQDIERLSTEAAQMTFVSGSRRIGKTTLLASVYEANTLYFFAAKKAEILLCEEYREEIKNKLGATMYGDIRSFKDIFGYLMELSCIRHFTLIIDEFQEFLTINPSVYDDMRNIWDRKKKASRMNLVLCGSARPQMSRIFEDERGPLFDRATAKLVIHAFEISVLKTILAESRKAFTNEDLLAFYMITGGVPKYVEMLTDKGLCNLDAILDEVFSKNSLFLEEGRLALADCFDRNSGNYASILGLIASGKTTWPELTLIPRLSAGGYLDKLENDYALIEKRRSLFSRPQTRNVKYRIKDNFLNFWFRFVYRYRGALEIGNYEYVKDRVKREYETYSKGILERYYLAKMQEEENLTVIGPYWEGGGVNNIEIVALNDFERTAVIAEVKRRKKEINIPELRARSVNLLRSLSGYKIRYAGFSVEDM